MFWRPSCCRNVIKQLVDACACIELWTYVGSSENTAEAKVALGCASSNSYTSVPCASITRYTHAKHEPIFFTPPADSDDYTPLNN